MNDGSSPTYRGVALEDTGDIVGGATGDVLLGLGSNLGDPPTQLSSAIRRLAPILSIEAISDLYRTEPVGVRLQPDFANLVMRGRTTLSVRDLLAATQIIEKEMGRTEGLRYGPRLIDIDVLAYDEVVISSDVLVVPHPWLHRRSFVLVPLAEIAPDWRHPVIGSTAADMLADLRNATSVTRIGPLILR